MTAESHGLERPFAPALDVQDVTVVYRIRRAVRRRPLESTSPSSRNHAAVDGVSVTVDRGEFVSLVGESGSGKTTLGLAIAGLRPVASGSIRVAGLEVARAKRRELAQHVQFVFQDPYDALDPRHRVQRIVEQPLRIHRPRWTREERERAVAQALDHVGLTPVSAFARRLPAELSGGQRQRVTIAAALTLEPKLLIADEPVSMLDVSVRSSILRLLDELCKEGLAILMITHDLSTAATYSDRIVVMKSGTVVEQGEARFLCQHPAQPYTRALLAAVPRLPEVPDDRLEP